jgi:hypothetical protein
LCTFEKSGGITDVATGDIAPVPYHFDFMLQVFIMMLKTLFVGYILYKFLLVRYFVLLAAVFFFGISPTIGGLDTFELRGTSFT